MTNLDAWAFPMWCFIIGGIAVLVCLHSLIAWQAREALERIATRRKTKRVSQAGGSKRNG